MSPLASPRPRFSIVSAVYNVEPYLPDFIASIEAQRFDLGRVEVIAVDDGSTDGSRGILEDWARRRPGLVTVLSQPNGGQASARNLGLEHATGEWVTFSDPDDMLDREFLAVADRFAAAHPDVEVLGAKPVVLDEATGQVTDSHPRRRQYAAGNRVVDLERRPSTFLGVSAGSLFRLDRIRASELRYDPRIRPNFEDGHFAGRYVLGLDVPQIGLLRDAKYLYRRRTSKDSTLQTSYSHPGRYSDVLRYGYLDLLQSARDRDGFVPAWVQHLVIYELSWYLSEDEKVATSIRIADDVVPQFHGLLADVVAFLDPAVVLSPTARRLKPTWAAILAYGLRPDAWRSPVAVRTKVDRVTGLQRVCYRYTGAAPPEEFRLDGAPVAPVHGKVMAHVYYRRTLLHERVAWLPADGTLEVRLGGEPIPIVADWLLPVRPVSPAAPNEVPAAASGRGRPRVGPRAALRPLRRAAGRAAARLAVLPTQVAAWLAGVPVRLGTWRDRTLAGAWPHRSRYRSAWVLMDRTHEAGDNGERLFEHIRAERPDVNAWFVVEKGTADWERLHASRPDRVVAHGSFRWRMLMLNSSWLLSSHADQVVAEPPAILRIVGKPTWKYGFLQHGVIKDDLSLWLNDRDIDLFVVSTQAELASIAADGTTYRFTTLETRDTGLPRFDRLLARGRAVPADERDLVIVAPTWRTFLTRPSGSTSQRKTIDAGLRQSEYFRSWDLVLRSPEIARAAARHGRRVAFMPHPEMQALLGQVDLPPHVEGLTFAGTDVQDLYARCALLVTDYSSVAFNIAVIDGSVVYFQFDRDQVMSGSHMGRQGYFDYERDGFGPVTTDSAAAIAAIVEAIERGPRPAPVYQARIDRTFPNRDGGACARVVAAIEELSRPYVPPATPGTA